jgi:Transposase, Mutator family
VEQADTDLLRGIVKLYYDRVIGEEIDAICRAPYGKRSEERTNLRNGYGTQGLGHPDRDDRLFRPKWAQPRPASHGQPPIQKIGVDQKIRRQSQRARLIALTPQHPSNRDRALAIEPT